ncbi:unnamed protein product [Rotaria socialis]|uniref:FYVE-type domain-containing protein n=2 Tax=Rotaria socialis TaxID=392032 RepID=A0A820JNL3_9BILA|nr:unnamed protein product [Rotaria socialis]CAF3646921.1 unnamed protein product [Rotaria socialis]CAF3708164.1 unnamed protein product [Rotaria socialis]CAF4330138.1 unnamed protein product [Rotaria socialis]CAF4397711.1 unnamed protein product [Rotaria socialis]
MIENNAADDSNDQSTLESASSNATSSGTSNELAIIRLNIQCEKLKSQLHELTANFNESQAAGKHAYDERDKYLKIYARTHERFVAFEKKQLEQMRRLLTVLTIDQYKFVTETIGSKERPTDSSQIQQQQSDTSSSIVDDSQSKEISQETKTTNKDDDTKLSAARYHKTDSDWDELLTQITQIMDLSQKCCDKCSQQREENNKLRLLNIQKQEENVQLLFDLSLAKAENEKEQQIRSQIEKQLSDANIITDQLTNLTQKTEKNDSDLQDMKSHYENLFAEQVNNIKKLVKERELLHLYIQRLEIENSSLVKITNDDDTVKLLNYSSQSPSTYEEAWGLIVKLREQIIQQLKIKEKLKNDIQQLQYNHKADLREREQIEHLLNRDLNAAKDEIIVLRSLQTEYERVMSLKNNLEKQLEERVNELKATKTVANSFTNQLKEKLEQITKAKDQVDEENVTLRVQIQKLKIDLENNEVVQHDFVKLSQTLQVQLEEIRNSENELRWQPEEDHPECQRCHSQFSVTWRKHHCRHCGKVLCKDCTNKTVYTGPHNRPSRVCDVCYTLLVKDSQPYFHSSVPNV